MTALETLQQTLGDRYMFEREIGSMETVIAQSPLPPGEGQGEGETTATVQIGLPRLRLAPHPIPLPWGEGVTLGVFDKRSNTRWLNQIVREDDATHWLATRAAWSLGK